MDLNQVLTLAYDYLASDIHLKEGTSPLMRVAGRLQPMPGLPVCQAVELEQTLLAIMSPGQRDSFLQTQELDMAYVVPGIARYRVNVFQQRGVIGAVFRVIPFQAYNIDQLQLPPVIHEIAKEQRGLVLVTGTTGCGKSTTMAAIIDQINQERMSHILTIEEPIEFLMKDKQSVINQREIGTDTKSYAAALKSALRQDPDIIFIGEMRDIETIEIALTAAETGHLVLSTLHTLDVVETINRIVAVFPPHQQRQIRTQLGAVLKAVICQRLVSKADGSGRIPAVEVMRMTSHIRDMIDDPIKTRDIPDALAAGHINYGMQTFDQSLMKWFSTGVITYEEALRQATNPNDFALRCSGIKATSDESWSNFETEIESSIENEPEIILGSKYE